MDINQNNEQFAKECGLLSECKELISVFDEGTFVESEKFDSASLKTGYGYINGIKAVAFSQNGEAVSTKSVNKIKKVYLNAQKLGCPIVSIFDSKGGKADENLDCLEAYATLMNLSSSISGVVPQIAIIDGCAIGSAAILCSLYDVVIMTKDSKFYVTGAEILDDKTAKVGCSDTAAKAGTVTNVVNSIDDAIALARQIITYLPSNNLSSPLFTEYAPANGTVNDLKAESVVNGVFDNESFIEMQKDYGCDAVIGLARIKGEPVAAVITDCDGASLSACASSKAARFVRFADAFNIPVVSFINCNGIMANKADELVGGVKLTSQLVHAYSEATTAKVTVITGNAIGNAYVSFCSRNLGIDSLFAWPNATVGALKPASYVQFMKADELKKGADRASLEKAYTEGEASAVNAAKEGFIEDIILPSATAEKVAEALELLSSKRLSTLDKKHSNINL